MGWVSSQRTHLCHLPVIASNCLLKQSVMLNESKSEWHSWIYYNLQSRVYRNKFRIACCLNKFFDFYKIMQQSWKLV